MLPARCWSLHQDRTQRSLLRGLRTAALYCADASRALRLAALQNPHVLAAGCDETLPYGLSFSCHACRLCASLASLPPHIRCSFRCIARVVERFDASACYRQDANQQRFPLSNRAVEHAPALLDVLLRHRSAIAAGARHDRRWVGR